MLNKSTGRGSQTVKVTALPLKREKMADIRPEHTMNIWSA